MCGKLSLSLTGNSADSSAGRGLVLLLLICFRHMRDIKILPLWLWSIWWIVTRQNTPSRSAPGGNPPLFFLQTAQSAFTVKPRQITAQLLCYRGSRRKYTVYDPMIWFDTMTHWVQEWSCRHPAARPHAAHKTACQSPLRGGGGDPGRTGRKRSSMPNFLTPTQTHNRLRSPGADHKGLWVAWMEAANCWAHLSWKNMFSVPAAGQQNDGAAEPIKYSLARQRLKSVCWK